jgi:hypothetical protein
MKISRKGNNTIISEVNSNAIAAFIRFPATTKFVFTNVKNVEQKVYIHADKKGNCILVVEKDVITKEGKIKTTLSDEYTKSFEATLKFIGEMLKRGVLTLEINNQLYITNRKFYDITEKINSKLSAKVKYFDYDFSNSVYSIIYPERNKLPMKLHYFEINNSVLMFDEKGPHLLFGQATKKIQSVLDILTKE